MTSLNITRLQLYPTGGNGRMTLLNPNLQQSRAGWLDIKNTGSWPFVNLAAVELTNRIYIPSDQVAQRESVIKFPVPLLLDQGQTIRVHFGKRDLSVIRGDDFAGVELHIFTEDFRCSSQGGILTLWDPRGERIDEVSYLPNTPAEVVLVRAFAPMREYHQHAYRRQA